MRSTEANASHTASNTNTNARTSVASESSSELGVIKLHDNVLAALVSKAVLGVEGVSRLAGSAIIDNLAGIVGSHSRAIEIIKNAEDDKLRFVVKVNLLFGCIIPNVAVDVQHAVIEQVESSAGVAVSAVDVIIQQLDEKRVVEDDDAADIAADQAAMISMTTMG